MVNDFYADLDLKYPEIAICMEDTDTGIGKFFIPVLTPTLNRDFLFDEVDYFSKKNNIIDYKNHDIQNITMSNYIELDIPNKTPLKKGQEVIIVFIGGDITTIRIIGGY